MPAPLQHAADTEPILEVEGLRKYYPVRGNSLKDVLGRGEKRQVKAVDDVSFSVKSGSTLGIVGESGCGKSTLVKTLIGLEESTGGEAQFLGFDITNKLAGRDLKLIRELQMVFQNPDSTMNPSYTVGQQIARPMRRFNVAPKSEIRNEVVKLLQAIRLNESYLDRFPRQLSGGEKQRVGIARALASRPDLVLCDEPVSALDVSVQAAILNLLLEIQQESGATMLFIAHDLSVVRFFSDYVAVMYLGQIMEYGPAEAIYAPPVSSLHRGVAVSRAHPRPGCEAETHPPGGSLCPARLDPPYRLSVPHPLSAPQAAARRRQNL